MLITLFVSYYIIFYLAASIEKQMTPQTVIRESVNLNDYDSVSIGQYIETPVGDFVCKSKPNIYQPIDSRFWLFEQVTDETGEPLMNGEVLKINN